MHDTSTEPSTRRRTIRRRSSLALATLALVAASCGSDAVPIIERAGAADATADAAVADAPASGAAALVGSTSLGDILVGDDGRTLYGFTNDVDAISACSGTCAEAWPPVIVDENFTVAPALDVGIFATTQRDDGTLQLVAGKWPLYFFAGDAVPGDIAGQGSGDVWFAVTPEGSLIEDAAPVDASSSDAAVIVAVGSTDAGDVLVDGAGLSLYGFTEDVDRVPTCNDGCASAWPPVLLPTNELPADLDSAIFSVSERADGTFQLNAGKWPLYLFAGDEAPGDINGQGSGDVWFLAAPDGALINGEASEDADY
jgi:predicted lipoprotein with Yx(FWY)xxD motif